MYGKDKLSLSYVDKLFDMGYKTQQEIEKGLNCVKSDFSEIEKFISDKNSSASFWNNGINEFLSGTTFEATLIGSIFSNYALSIKNVIDAICTSVGRIKPGKVRNLYDVNTDPDKTNMKVTESWTNYIK